MQQLAAARSILEWADKLTRSTTHAARHTQHGTRSTAHAARPHKDTQREWRAPTSLQQKFLQPPEHGLYQIIWKIIFTILFAYIHCKIRKLRLSPCDFCNTPNSLVWLHQKERFYTPVMGANADISHKELSARKHHIKTCSLVSVFK